MISMNRYGIRRITLCVLVAMFSLSVQAEEIRITSGEWSPFTGEKLPFNGLLSALVDRAFAEEDIETVYGYFPWQRSYDLAAEGTWQASTSWIKTAERERTFLFSEPIIEVELGFFHQASLNFSWNTIDDLKAYRIGVVSNFTYGEAFDQAVARGDLTPKTYNNNKSLLLALIANEIDLAPIVTHAGLYLLDHGLPERRPEITIDERIIDRYGIHLIFPRTLADSAVNKRKFDRGLAALRRTGAYQDIIMSFHTVMEIDSLNYYTEEFAPLNYTRNGQLRGVTVDILLAMLAKLGSGISADNINVLPWSRAYQLAQQDSRAVLFSTTRTPLRENLFKWVGPIFRSKVVLYGKADTPKPIENLSDAKELRVCAIIDDVGQQALLKRGFSDQQLLTVTNPRQCAQLLASGRVDLWAYGELAANWYIRDIGSDASAYNSLFLLEESSQYIALHPSVSDRIQDALQTTLDTLKLTGEFSRISDVYALP